MSDHQSVLVDEVVGGLGLAGDGWYIDATYGRGGHSAAILSALGDDGRLLALDKDPEAIAAAQLRFGGDVRFAIRHADFADLAEVAQPWLGTRRANGILLDLGVSSPQLDVAERGFSFSADGPLDMRMNNAAGRTLGQWLERIDADALGRVIADYGEQPGAFRIAAAIVAAQREKPIAGTAQLAQIVAAAAPKMRRGLHPATRVFQALRIALNDELGALRSVLQQSLALLAEGGRLAVISFHSLEDRIVKQFITEQCRGDERWAGMPNAPAEALPTLRRCGGLIRPSEQEIAGNPRSRSSRLRVAERINVAVAA